MWFIFGFISIIATIVNVYQFSKNKDYKLAMAVALATTSLTVLTLYNDVANLLIVEDWTSLLDVVPTMSSSLKFLVGTSILLNFAPLITDLIKESN